MIEVNFHRFSKKRLILRVLYRSEMPSDSLQIILVLPLTKFREFEYNRITL